jgi:hypothetical protein
MSAEVKKGTNFLTANRRQYSLIQPDLKFHQRLSAKMSG